MTKLIVIETCGDCGSHKEYKLPAYDQDIGVELRSVCHFDPKHPKTANPDSPPPDNCPLTDLDAVLDELDEATSGVVVEKTEYTDAYNGGWRDALNAVRKLLEGGGDSE